LWRGFCLLLARLLLLLLLDCRGLPDVGGENGGGGAAGVASLRRLASSCSSPAACLASHAPASLPANLCSASSMPFLGLLPHLFLGSFPSRMRRTACSACLTYKCGLHLARWFFIRMCLNCSAASRCPLLPCCSARRCAYRSMHTIARRRCFSSRFCRTPASAPPAVGALANSVSSSSAARVTRTPGRTLSVAAVIASASS